MRPGTAPRWGRYNSGVMDGLRQRLDELIGLRSREPLLTRARPVCGPSPLEDALGGGEVVSGARRCWQVNTPFARICAEACVRAEHLGALRAWGRRGVVIDPARAMVLDIETAGFAGVPVFLIGVVLLDEAPLRVQQFLARDYPEEEAILHAFAGLAGRRDTWITFNGRSFDEPFLRDRAARYRLPLPKVQHHIDLLHVARRAWPRGLPNHRLGTLEQYVLRRPRVGDVPSSDVPDLFRHFIETGNARVIAPVLDHNRRDLVACTELLVILLGQPAPSPAPPT